MYTPKEDKLKDWFNNELKDLVKTTNNISIYKGEITEEKNLLKQLEINHSDQSSIKEEESKNKILELQTKIRINKNRLEKLSTNLFIATMLELKNYSLSEDGKKIKSINDLLAFESKFNAIKYQYQSVDFELPSHIKSIAKEFSDIKDSYILLKQVERENHSNKISIAQTVIASLMLVLTFFQLRVLVLQTEVISNQTSISSRLLELEEKRKENNQVEKISEKVYQLEKLVNEITKSTKKNKVAKPKS